MPYTSHAISGTDQGGNPIGEVWAVASVGGMLRIWANPSQDYWTLSPTTYVATEITDSFGPQHAAFTFGSYTYTLNPTTPTGDRLRNTDAWAFTPSARLPNGGSMQGISAAEERQIRAAASDGTTIWVFTDRNLYTATLRDPSQPNRPNFDLVLVGPHGLTEVSAAAYWPALGGVIVGAGGGLRILNPAQRTSQPLVSEAPAGLRSLTVHGGALLGVTAAALVRFDASELTEAAVQTRGEARRDSWQVIVRERRSLRPFEYVPNDSVIRAEVQFAWQEVGTGYVSFRANAISREAVELIESGGALVEVDYQFLDRDDRKQRLQYLGLVRQTQLRKTSRDFSTSRIGDVRNCVIVLGAEEEGTGGSACRRVARPRNETSVDGNGLHEDLLDQRQAQTDTELVTAGRARLSQERPLESSTDHATVGSDITYTVFMRDVWDFAAKRIVNCSGTSEFYLAAATGGEYINTILRREWEQNPPDLDYRNLANETAWALDAASVHVGGRIEYGVRWDNLFDVLTVVCRAQHIGLAYALEEEPRRIVFRVAPANTRNSGTDHLTVSDAVPTPDLDIRPGDVYQLDRWLPNSDRPFLSVDAQTCYSLTVDLMPGREVRVAPNTSFAPLSIQDLVDALSRRTQAARVS